jgi:AbrB family looped-hinge helix DNA binding protein
VERIVSEIIGYLTIDQKGRTTLPQRVREQLGIGEGTQLRIERTESGIIELVPSVSIPQDQAWYHGDEGRARLGRADEELRSGRVSRTRGEAAARRLLDSLRGSAGRPVVAKRVAKKATKRAAKR